MLVFKNPQYSVLQNRFSDIERVGFSLGDGTVGDGAMKKTVKQICIAVTDRCNARCTQCYAWKRTPRKEFTIRELRQIFENSELENLQSISISGGEPLMRRDILEVLTTIQDYHRGALILQSNCSFPERLLWVTEQIEGISVCCSLDGLKGTHERIRGNHIRFDNVIKVARALKERRIPFVVSMTVQPANQHEITGVYGIAEQLNAPFWCRPAQVGEFFSKGFQDPIDRELVVSQLQRIKIYNALWLPVVIEFLKKSELPFQCHAGLTSCVITPNLDVFPCSMASSSWFMGNLRNTGYRLNTLLGDFHSRSCRKCINEIAHSMDVPLRLIYPTVMQRVVRYHDVGPIVRSVSHPWKILREICRAITRDGS